MYQQDLKEELYPLIEQVLPGLKAHRIISKSATVESIVVADIAEYAENLGIPTIVPKSDPPEYIPLETVLQALARVAGYSDIYSTKYSFLDKSKKGDYPPPVLKKKAFENDFFGLPYIDNQSAGALLCRSRKLMDSYVPADKFMSNERRRLASKVNFASEISGSDISRTINEKQESSHLAQRKVARALMTMVGNEKMLFHFVTKGGIDAVSRLVRDCKLTFYLIIYL